MSESSEELKRKIDQFCHYYEIFEDDGKCKAVRSHKLLRDMLKIIPSLQDEIDARLIELGFIEADRKK